MVASTWLWVRSGVYRVILFKACFQPSSFLSLLSCQVDVCIFKHLKYNHATEVMTILHPPKVQLPVCNDSFLPSGFAIKVSISADVWHTTPGSLHHLHSVIIQDASHLVGSVWGNNHTEIFKVRFENYWHLILNFLLWNLCGCWSYKQRSLITSRQHYTTFYP